MGKLIKFLAGIVKLAAVLVVLAFVGLVFLVRGGYEDRVLRACTDGEIPRLVCQYAKHLSPRVNEQ